MQENLVMQGVELMLVGMGTVFVFLTALVAATTLMSRLVARNAPGPFDTTGNGPTNEEIAAITAALARHRRRTD